MMDIDKILQYQRLDNELYKLNRASANNEEKVIMNKMIAYVKDAQNKSTELESRAKVLVDEYKSLKKNYDTNYKKVQKITNNDNISDENIKKDFEQINTLSSELFMIERTLNQIINKAKEILKEFEITKSNAVKARARHKASKEKYEAMVGEYAPKIEKLRAELKTLEKGVDTTLLDKYKSVRNDKVFPVFVPLDGKSCAGCRMEIASSKLNKLTPNSFITCEHCGRQIYKK